MKNKKKVRNIYIEGPLVMSDAWRSLTATAKDVYLIFLCKRQLTKFGSGRTKRYEMTNNGKITFTYQEAEEDHQIKAGAFRRSIDCLLDRGFIDITEPGSGYKRMQTLYAISNRWKEYGNQDFKVAIRPKVHSRGFTKGNELWKRKKNISTVTNEHRLCSRTNIDFQNHYNVMFTNEHNKIVRKRYKVRNGRVLSA